MLKGCLVCAGLAVTGLLVASCAATPQSAATEIAAQEALVIATQAEADAAQSIAAATQAATQPTAVATAVNTVNPNGRPTILVTAKYIIVQYPGRQPIMVPRASYTDQSQ